MIQTVDHEKMFVKEMSKWTMSYVVQQSGQSHERFDTPSTWHVGTNFPQAFVQCRDSTTGQVHRPHDMLETSMLGRRKDPPGSLQLMDLAHPLHPGMVDQLPFADFAS